jgi:hypothetical protein
VAPDSLERRSNRRLPIGNGKAFYGLHQDCISNCDARSVEQASQALEPRFRYNVPNRRCKVNHADLGDLPEESGSTKKRFGSALLQLRKEMKWRSLRRRSD